MTQKELIQYLTAFIEKTDKMLENTYESCSGFYVDHQEFNNFMNELNRFFNANFDPGHPIILEFREIVTDPKKHKIIQAKVLLKELAEELSKF